MDELSVKKGKWLGAYALILGIGYGAAALVEAEDFALLSEISPAIVLLIVGLPLLPMIRKLTRGMAW